MLELTKEQLRKAIASGDPALMKLASEYLDLASSPYHSWRPRPDRPQDLDQQTGFVEDRSKGVICLIGGTGSGKSMAAAWKVARFLKTTSAPRPNTPYWIVSVTVDMASSANWRHLSNFIAPGEIRDISWHSQVRGQPRAVVLKNGWMIEFKSAEMDRKALQAVSLGGWHCDELVPQPIIVELLMRCREYDFPGGKLYTLTPLVDGSRGYDTTDLEEIYKDRENRKDWSFWRLNSRLNTALAEGFVDRAIASEVEELQETRLTGAFCSLQGAVYKGFLDHHVVKAHPIPDGWFHLRGIDFGYSHETAVMWVARDPRGVYHIYREYLKQKALLRDHYEAITAVPWGKDPNVWGPTWADSAAAQERRELASMGLQTYKARKDVLPGIGVVQRLLRDKQLLIHDCCRNLIRQMRSYRWSPVVKDKVDKQDDDAVDALRYALASDSSEYKPRKEPGMEPSGKRLAELEAKFMNQD